MIIFKFTKEDVNKWEIENDFVMGGKSTSLIHHIIQDGLDMLKFSGHVSLENNGGFAQTQHVYETFLDLSAFSHVIISGRGDGKIYTLRFETFDEGVSYEFKFKASGNFKEEIKFDNLSKIFHGEPVTDKPDFDKSKIRTICILIGNGAEEDFEICIDEIVASI